MKEDWNLIHDFCKGYGWRHVRTYMVVYRFDLTVFNIEFNDFPLLEQSRIDAIVGSILSKRKRITEALQKNKEQIHFDTITMPLIKKEFPKLSVNDLVKTNPMKTATYRWAGVWYKPWTWFTFISYSLNFQRTTHGS